jgi:hypothetical protein
MGSTRWSALAGMRLRRVVIVACITGTDGFARNKGLLPNGLGVPCPDGIGGCSNGLCEGIGHGTCAGGSLPLNAFGTAFLAAGSKWTESLCQTDSDGDGLSNGIRPSILPY